MKKSILLVFGILLILGNVNGKNIACTTTEFNGGPHGYDYVKQWDDTTDPDTDYHFLTCKFPGKQLCVWKGGSSPCSGSGGSIPVPDAIDITVDPIHNGVVIEDDDGTVYDIEISVLNQLIFNQLMDGNLSGLIFVGDYLQISFSYSLIYDENEEIAGYTLRVNLLTGEDMLEL